MAQPAIRRSGLVRTRTGTAECRVAAGPITRASRCATPLSWVLRPRPDDGSCLNSTPIEKNSGSTPVRLPDAHLARGRLDRLSRFRPVKNGYETHNPSTSAAWASTRCTCRPRRSARPIRMSCTPRTRSAVRRRACRTSRSPRRRRGGCRGPDRCTAASPVGTPGFVRRSAAWPGFLP